MAEESKTYELPQLPYDFSALEPIISREIMELHYSKHHKGYVTQLNAALGKYKEAEVKGDMEEMIALQPLIRFHGGGHINHSLFWPSLTPPSKATKGPSGALAEAIEKDLGSWDRFKERLTEMATALQGSGWAWLGYHKGKRALELATCFNQDPLSASGMVPLLGIDVWEHAYYLQYKNVRGDYVKAIWGILNWPVIEGRFAKGSL